MDRGKRKPREWGKERRKNHDTDRCAMRRLSDESTTCGAHAILSGRYEVTGALPTAVCTRYRVRAGAQYGLDLCADARVERRRACGADLSASLWFHVRHVPSQRQRGANDDDG